MPHLGQLDPLSTGRGSPHASQTPRCGAAGQRLDELLAELAGLVRRHAHQSTQELWDTKKREAERDASTTRTGSDTTAQTQE